MAFQILDQVQEDLRDGLRDLINAPELLRSLTNFPYLRVMKQKPNPY